MEETIKFKPKNFNFQVLPRVLEHISTLEDAEYELSIKKIGKKRSLNANAYFHLLVGEIAEKMNIGFDQCKVNLNLEYGTIARDEQGKKI